LGAGCRRRSGRATDAERRSLIEAGWGDLFDQVFRSKDLARGDRILFAATGISDSPLLRDVEVRGSVAIRSGLLGLFWAQAMLFRVAGPWILRN
jgi:fructose-1,6-bisphosphatase II